MLYDVMERSVTKKRYRNCINTFGLNKTTGSRYGFNRSMENACYAIFDFM